MSAYERSNGWRDWKLSERHRLVYGRNCPCVDIDLVLPLLIENWLVVELNNFKPAAIVEYKNANRWSSVDLNDAQHSTLCDLADKYDNKHGSGIPFLLVTYWEDIWAYRVRPCNGPAKRFFTTPFQDCTEHEYVKTLHAIRGIEWADALRSRNPPKVNVLQHHLVADNKEHFIIVPRRELRPVV